jgi:hypothetical protein
MNPQELLINVLREKDIRLATVVSQRCLSRQRLNSVSTREVALIERRLSNWCVTTKSTQDVEVSVVVTINSAISIAILKAKTTKIMMKLFHKKNASYITKKKI